MPQGLSAGPQTAYRPGSAGRQQTGDRRVPQHAQARVQQDARLSAAISARPVRRRSNRSSAANSWWQQNQDRRAAGAHDERAGRPPQDRSTTPRNWPFCASRPTAGLPPQARRIRR